MPRGGEGKGVDLFISPQGKGSPNTSYSCCACLNSSSLGVVVPHSFSFPNPTYALSPVCVSCACVICAFRRVDHKTLISESQTLGSRQGLAAPLAILRHFLSPQASAFPSVELRLRERLAVVPSATKESLGVLDRWLSGQAHFCQHQNVRPRKQCGSHSVALVRKRKRTNKQTCA